jgi:hypothetical protein
MERAKPQEWTSPGAPVQVMGHAEIQLNSRPGPQSSQSGAPSRTRQFYKHRRSAVSAELRAPAAWVVVFEWACHAARGRTTLTLATSFVHTNGRATIHKIAAISCAVSMCLVSSGLATDITTQAPQQEQISQNLSSLQSFPGTGQQSFIFGDWGGLRTSLSNQGIDLGLSYLSEPAWNVAGGMALGGTYAGQENLSIHIGGIWIKVPNLYGIRRYLDPR